MIAITELDMANLFNYSQFLVVCMFKNVCEYGNDPELYIQNILKYTNSQQEFLHSVLSKESDERCRNKG